MDRSYADSLRLASRLTEPAIRAGIRRMPIRVGSTGLDAGCGIGVHTRWLAEVAGPEGRVAGLDLSEDHLAEARRGVGFNPLAASVEFVQGDLLKLPFAEDAFDWAWTADTLYPVAGMRPEAGIQELSRVVRPGGAIGVAFLSSQSILCGHPELETRLAVAHTKTNSYLGGIEPRLHFLRALGWLRATGLEGVTAHTLVADMCGPLDPDVRESMAFWFDMFWGDLEPHLPAEDWSAYRRLCEPDSDDCVLADPDYYGLLTYTLFLGKVPGSGS